MIGVFLFAVAFVAGALNAVAGGGSFLTLPSLIYAGIAPVAANATSTFALWPGSVASSLAYRREVAASRAWLLALGLVSLLGGLLGALLLVRTSDASFMRLLPWLMLLAAVTFTFGNTVTARLRRRGRMSSGHPRGSSGHPPGSTVHPPGSTVHPRGSSGHPPGSTVHSPGPKVLPPGSTVHPPGSTVQERARGSGVPWWAFPLQLVIAVYGGYFGGGIGIMMLASLAIAGMADIHEMNGVKTVLAVAINGIAMAEFVVHGAVVWVPGFLMMAGGITGGYAGASVARRLPARAVRVFVIVIAWTMTVYFFVR